MLVIYTQRAHCSKNKVLKIFGTMVALQAQIAENGGKASAAQTVRDPISRGTMY
jgi:hypothetical protein